MKGIRIALVICDSETGEKILTRFIKPSRLMRELEVICEHKSWVVTETYVANSYGIRMEESE